MRTSGFKSTRFSVLLALFFGAGSFAAQESNEMLPLSDSANGDLNNVLAAPRPGVDWNCMNIDIGEKPLRVIMPKYHGLLVDDEAVKVSLLELVKVLVPQTVLMSSGEIGSAYADGSLVGIEFNIFPDDFSNKPDYGEFLPVLGLLEGENAQGEQGILGLMYCYDQALFDARIQALSGAGTTPSEQKLYLNAVSHTSSTGRKSLQVSGTSNAVHGPLVANGALRISGDGNWVSGDRTYGLEEIVNGEHTLDGSSVQAAASAGLGTVHDQSWYLNHSIANGMHFSDDIFIVAGVSGGPETSTGIPLDGVVYSTGSIYVEGDGIDATLTLVAVEEVVFLAGGGTWTGAVDDLLAFSIESQVWIPGSGNTLDGCIHAPVSAMTVSGSANVITGRFAVRSFLLSGDQNVLTDGTRR